MQTQMQRKPLFKQAAQDDHSDHLADGSALGSLPPGAAESLSGVSSSASAAPTPAPAPSPARAPSPSPAPQSRDVGPTLVSRIKQKLPLVDYAQRHMQLKPGSTGEYTGKCPDAGNHEGGVDNNASFYASSKTDAFCCHACNFTGNVIHLYAFFNGMGYTDAKMALGRELGVFNERSMDTTESMMLGAARKYIDQLVRKDDAMHYLTEVRKVTAESMQKFGIGFCWGREYQNMTPEQKGVAVAAGLLREASDRGPEKSFMAGRITFPVRDRIGRVVGFGGRLVPSEFKSFGPKYINSPETALFKKSELLYGAYEASAGITRTGCAVVLEGFLDVVVTHQLGADNTLAVMGASANETTFATLWSMTKRVVFCLDGDQAGAKGTLRSVLAAAPTMPDGCEIAIMSLPPGVDPDEFVLEHGIDAWNDLAENAVPLSRFLMNETVASYDLSYPEGRASFLEEAKRVGGLFATAPTVGEQIVAEARALSASGLVAYALQANNIGDNVETQLLRDAIALLQRTVTARAAAAAAPTPSAESRVAVAESMPEAMLTAMAPDAPAPRARRRP